MDKVKIICPFCGGTGRVKTFCCDGEFLYSDFLEEECVNCDGAGYHCEVQLTEEEFSVLEDLLKREMNKRETSV